MIIKQETINFEDQLAKAMSSLISGASTSASSTSPGIVRTSHQVDDADIKNLVLLKMNN